MAIAVDRAHARAGGLGTRSMRALTALHRYVGTALCLVFAIWFASGFVMMYAGYPQLSEAAKLARQAPLDAAAVRLSPAEAARRIEQPIDIEHVRLSMLLDRPIYLFATRSRGWLAVMADDGEIVPEIGEDTARTIALQFADETRAPRYLGLRREPDQWTIYFSWAPYLPSHEFAAFHKFALGDPAGTEISVLAATGDVTQATTSLDRALGYAGAVVHWIYPTTFRVRHAEAWTRLVVWLSLIGTLLCLSGIVMGIYYYRWQRAPGVSGSPYRRWLKWHHYVGLVFGVVTLSWVLSGLLSMDPLNWSEVDDGPLDSRLEALRGGALDLDAFARAPQDAAAACDAALETKELRLVQLRGEPFYECVAAPERSLLISGRGATPPFARFDTETIAAAAAPLMATYGLASAEMLDRYDDYYYPGWQDKTVDDGAKRLPVVKLRFRDPGDTLLYVDPHTAAPVGVYDSSGRRLRWLFNGLHSLSFGRFYRSRPLWDAVTLTLMAGGFALSLTSVWIGVKWLRRKTRRRPARAS